MEELDSKTVFDGAPFSVAEKRFRRGDGDEVERQVVEHPGSVAIVAHDDEVVHLVRQPREAVGDDGLLEIPAGTMDVEGESAASASSARRSGCGPSAGSGCGRSTPALASSPSD